MDKRRIAIVIGTKAELIKCMPVMLELQKRKTNYWFLHTGQHPLKEACIEFGIKNPDFILSKEPKKSTKFWSKVNRTSILWFLKMIFEIKRSIRRLNPSYVLYHGDTMSTAAAAIGSSNFLNFKKTWKNVHLEAGLRSGSLLEPFPEEISRQISDRFSDILLAVSELSEKNLEKKLKKNQRIIRVGNTVVDSSLIAYEKSKETNKKFSKDFALINIHRHENLRNKKRMERIVEIISHIKAPAIWPLHDNTESHLVAYGLMGKIKKMKNIKIVPLVGYSEFIFLISKCKYLITDGGSIQEESLVFKKPCLLLRNLTERQEGLSTGINFLTKLDVNYAKEVIEGIEKSHLEIKEFENPYGKKGLSKKIVDILIK